MRQTKPHKRKRKQTTSEAPATKLRVCRYLRKSRDDGNNETLEETLERHERMTSAMAADRGYEIQHTYPEVVSGASIEERPQMQQLLQDLKDRKWDVVIVVDISRLSRGDGSDQTMITNAFKLTNTKCLSEYRLFDLSNEDDLELFERKLQASRDEYREITKRLERGRGESALMGYAPCGPAPYGLKLVGPKRAKTYEIDPERFPTYRAIIEYCHDAPGATYCGLRTVLHDHGIPSPRGNEWWSIATLQALVNCDTHLGYLTWGKKKTEPYLTDDFGEKKRKVATDDYLRRRGNWPAFIDETYVLEARERINNSMPQAAPNKGANPLAGLLRCAKCGKVMAFSRNSANKKLYYSHRDTRYLNDEGCSAKSVQKDVLIRALVQSLSSMLKATEVELANGEVQERAQRLNKELKATQKAIAKGRQSLLDAYYRLDKGLIDEEVYNEVTEAKKDEIERLEAAASQLEKQVETNSTDSANAMVESLKIMLSVLEDDTLEPKQINEVLKTFIDHIDYTNDGVKYKQAHEIRLDVHLR